MTTKIFLSDSHNTVLCECDSEPSAENTSASRAPFHRAIWCTATRGCYYVILHSPPDTPGVVHGCMLVRVELMHFQVYWRNWSRCTSTTTLICTRCRRSWHCARVYRSWALRTVHSVRYLPRSSPRGRLLSFRYAPQSMTTLNVVIMLLFFWPTNTKHRARKLLLLVSLSPAAMHTA